ncbi:AMP-binding protein [Xanthobacter sp. ZOL 2024]
MRTFFEQVLANAHAAPERPLFSDAAGTLTRRGLLVEAGRLAAQFPASARVVGLLLPNGREWAVAAFACLMSGRIAVPLPPFFSPAQLAHVIGDAGIDLVLTTAGAPALPGLPCLSVRLGDGEGPWPSYREGFGAIIYTSGSTGRPKGVRHESGQLGWSAAALASAIGATAEDSYLSVLPLALLLEALCAVLVPALVGGRTYFDTALADAVGRGQPTGLAATYARHQPTVGVLVPELLRLWVGELAATGRKAPESLRFVAVGGAPVPAGVAAAAWQLGIPVHEGYGLSECCAVVALNRPGARVAGTVGAPLPGLAISLAADGEILVDGPSATDGYLGGPPARRPWATGDLGVFDDAGRLRVLGRKDNVIVTVLGRNVSAEWVETTLLDDPDIAACAVVEAQGAVAALILPTARAETALTTDPARLVAQVAARCAGLPAYARPVRIEAMTRAEALALQLLTGNGRMRRQAVRAHFAAATSAGAA